MDQYSKQIAILIIAISASLLYGWYLWNPIVFDDQVLFMGGSNLLASYTEHFKPFELRWIPYATFAWTTKVFGLELIYLRGESLLLHIAVGVSLYYLLIKIYLLALSKKINLPKDTKTYHWLALASALIFVLHPISVYAAGYLIQRSIVMAALFSILSLHFFIKGIDSNKTTAFFTCAVLYLLAVLCKENAIMLPGVMLAIAVTFFTEKIKSRSVVTLGLACIAIACYAFISKFQLIATVNEIDASSIVERSAIANPHAYSIITQCSLFFKYLGLWLVPNPAWMSVDMREHIASAFLSVQLIGVVFYIGYGLTALWLLLRKDALSLLGLAMIYPWLLFFTEFAAPRIQEPFVLYREYLWMPGVFIAAPLLLIHIRAKVLMTSFLALSVLLGLAASNRLQTFSHPLLLWDDAASLLKENENLPGSDRIYYNRANHLARLNHWDEAIEDYKKAQIIRPDYAEYHAGLGGAYMGLEKYDLALSELSEAIRLAPKLVRPYFLRAQCYLKLNQKDAAVADLNIACQSKQQAACRIMENILQSK